MCHGQRGALPFSQEEKQSPLVGVVEGRALHLLGTCSVLPQHKALSTPL